jgi:RNA polymerase sigma factor (sigma-70 family)
LPANHRLNAEVSDGCRALRSCHIEETRRGQRLDAPASTREASSPTTRRNQEAGLALPTLCDAYLSLSEERREVLLLVAIEGLQHEEAGAILGVPLGVVRSRLSQGRQALRQALEAGRTALASPPPAHRMQGISP